VNHSLGTSGPGLNTPENVPVNEPEEPEGGGSASCDTNSHYFQQLNESDNMWQTNHTDMYFAMASYLIPLSGCQICQSPYPLFRCTACRLASVCEDCLQQQHRHNPPHVVQVWKVINFLVVKGTGKFVRI
jgi:hypothetical protein